MSIHCDLRRTALIPALAAVFCAAVAGQPPEKLPQSTTAHQAAFNDARAALHTAEGKHFLAEQRARNVAFACQHADEDLQATQTALDMARIHLARTRDALWSAGPGTSQDDTDVKIPGGIQ